MLVYVCIKPTYQTSDGPTLLSQQFIFCTFLQITLELKEIVYYSKRPIGLFFHALLHEAIKLFTADVRRMEDVYCKVVI